MGTLAIESMTKKEVAKKAMELLINPNYHDFGVFVKAHCAERYYLDYGDTSMIKQCLIEHRDYVEKMISLL